MKYRMAMAALLGMTALSLSVRAEGLTQGDPAKAQKIVTQTCAACHGADGNSTNPTYPKLAGQGAAYLYAQLSDFKKHDGKPAKRPNPIMGAIVANLSQDDMHNLAAYFSSQKPKLGYATDAKLAKAGEAIYRGGIMDKNVPACMACHSADGGGIPTEFPRLAGQHAQYVVAQLQAFRSGARANDPNAMMQTIASKLSDNEMKAVAQYISGLH
jgi:cytochrome c553